MEYPPTGSEDVCQLAALPEAGDVDTKVLFSSAATTQRLVLGHVTPVRLEPTCADLQALGSPDAASVEVSTSPLMLTTAHNWGLAHETSVSQLAPVGRVMLHWSLVGSVDVRIEPS
jgi:hypothetical protein